MRIRWDVFISLSLGFNKQGPALNIKRIFSKKGFVTLSDADSLAEHQTSCNASQTITQHFFDCAYQTESSTSGHGQPPWLLKIGLFKLPPRGAKKPFKCVTVAPNLTINSPPQKQMFHFFGIHYLKLSGSFTYTFNQLL